MQDDKTPLNATNGSNNTKLKGNSIINQIS